MRTFLTGATVMVTLLVLTSATILARGGGPLEGILKELNLNPAQQQQVAPLTQKFQRQMQTIQSTFQERLKGILTPAQMNRLQQLRDQGQQDALGHLDLTPDQKHKVKALREERRPHMEAAFNTYVSDVDAILTQQQRVRFAELRKERKPGPGGHHGQ